MTNETENSVMAGRVQSHLTIGLHPFALPENAYIARNREILEALGSVVAVPRARILLRNAVSRLFRLKRLKCFDVIILNWSENEIVSRGSAITLQGICTYFLLLGLCRLVSKKLVCVRHNDIPHGVLVSHQKRTRWLIAQGQRLADSVVAHSPVYAEEHGYHYVPHPLYQLAPTGPVKHSDEYVVFGQIRRYKAVHQLIEVWSSSSTLVVAGLCENDVYLAELQKLADGKSVRLDIGFLEEHDLALQIASSKGIIIANDPQSLIVSGTFFFAVSSGARIFAIDNPFCAWIKSTPLGRYVRTFDSIAALALHLEQNDADESQDPASIRDEAQRLFGDEYVLRAWREVLG